MNVIAWNCHGTRKATIERGLKNLVRNSSPAGLFLMEKKADKSRMEKVCRLLSFDNSEYVEAVGSVSSLALF